MNNADVAKFAHAIHRIEAVQEIEELTPFPVPTKSKAEIADRYFVSVANDLSIRNRKISLGRQTMEKAWAESLQTVDGWNDLAERIPDNEVVVMYHMGAYGARLMGRLYVTKNVTKTLTVKDIADHFTQAGEVAFLMKDTPLALADVMMPNTRTVVLSLKEADKHTKEM
jgi:hypothetical protein